MITTADIKNNFRFCKRAALFACAIFVFGCAHSHFDDALEIDFEPDALKSSSAVKALVYKVVAEYPHDYKCFTQGLFFLENTLYESCGQYGNSRVQSFLLTDFFTDKKNVQLNRKAMLSRKVFAEGFAHHDGQFVVLSWRQQQAHVFDEKFRPVNSLRYQGQGWGLTHDKKYWLMSNGSAQISERDSDDFSLIKKWTVTRSGKPVKFLNELEFAHGLLIANVWMSNEIFFIDPSNRSVIATMDLSELVAQQKAGPERVLNGIAYFDANDTLWVTGKNWKKIYELDIDWGQLAP